MIIQNVILLALILNARNGPGQQDKAGAPLSFLGEAALGDLIMAQYSCPLLARALMPIGLP